MALCQTSCLEFFNKLKTTRWFFSIALRAMHCASCTVQRYHVISWISACTPPPSLLPIPPPPPFLLSEGKTRKFFKWEQEKQFHYGHYSGYRIHLFLKCNTKGIFFNLHHHFGIILDALAIIIMQLCYQNYALNTGEKFNLTFRSVADIHSNYFACRSKRRENRYNFPTCEKKPYYPSD